MAALRKTKNDLIFEINRLEAIIKTYRSARKINGLCGRGWDSSKHLEAEMELHRFGEPGSTEWHTITKLKTVNSDLEK